MGQAVRRRGVRRRDGNNKFWRRRTARRWRWRTRRDWTGCGWRDSSSRTWRMRVSSIRARRSCCVTANRSARKKSRCGRTSRRSISSHAITADISLGENGARGGVHAGGRGDRDGRAVTGRARRSRRMWRQAQAHCGVPVVLGSGMDAENIGTFLAAADYAGLSWGRRSSAGALEERGGCGDGGEVYEEGGEDLTRRGKAPSVQHPAPEKLQFSNVNQARPPHPDPLPIGWGEGEDGRVRERWAVRGIATGNNNPPPLVALTAKNAILPCHWTCACGTRAARAERRALPALEMRNV